MTPAQRRSYQLVFGDPLDWVRRRLGHASIETTLVYVHVLAEVELETRLALIGDGDPWEPAVLLHPDDAADEASQRRGDPPPTS